MSDTLSIKDNRTGKEYEIEIVDGNISASQLRQIKENEGDFGMMSYDPGFLNTANCTSRITDLHGSEGILRYRGYPIEQLAEKSTFLDVVYLLFNSELPNAQQSSDWEERITHHTMLHEKTKRLMGGFNYDAHPMGVFISTPTIASYAYRNSKGLPYIYPDNELSYTGNFLNMMYRMVEPRYQAHPVPFVSVAGAAAALYGPSHGGANEAVLNMLREIGTKDKVADYVKRCKGGELRLMGCNGIGAHRA